MNFLALIMELVSMVFALAHLDSQGGNVMVTTLISKNL